MSSKHILEHKKEYLFLLESFLTKKFDGTVLRDKFYDRRSEDLKKDRDEKQDLAQKEYSGQITWEEYKSALIKDYGFPPLDHPFTDLVDAVYSELKRFCQPSDMEAFDPEEDIDEEELEIRIRKLLSDYKANI